MVVVYPCLVIRYNTPEKSSWILIVIFPKFFKAVNSMNTLKWCEVSVSVVCKPSSAPSNRWWFRRVTSLRCPIRQLRVEQKFVDHAHLVLFNSSNTFIGHRGCWSTTSWCIFEDSCWIVELSYPFCNSALWWSRVIVNIDQFFSYFCCA